MGENQIKVLTNCTQKFQNSFVNCEDQTIYNKASGELDIYKGLKTGKVSYDLALFELSYGNNNIPVSICIKMCKENPKCVYMLDTP